MDKKKILTVRRILVIIFLIVFSLIAYISYRGSYLEYQELGQNFLNTFLTKQKYFYKVMLINLIFMYIIMYFSGRGIKKGLKVFFEQEKKEIPKLPNKSIAIVFSAIESIFIAIKFTPSIILAISNTSFGETNPIFNLDVSFYMFIEPLLKMSIIYFIGICALLIFYSFLYYILVFNKYFNGVDKETLKNSKAMKILYRNLKLVAIGLALYILVSSMDIVFDNFLTTDNNIKLIGAGMIDSTVKFWGYNILSIVLLISIFKAINSLKNGKQTKLIKDLAIVPIYLVTFFIIMVGLDLTLVRPNEFDKERDYIEYNMYATKKAYAIECEDENINYSGTITVDQIEKNNNIINNAVIIDKDTVLNNLKATQTGTGYYTYKTAKLSEVLLDGKKEVVYISPREILNNRRTYNSKTYEYTHGYGLIFTSATKTNENGELVYIQNDISSENQDIQIKTPQIYYGLETNSTVVTNAKNKKEFDYEYDGKDYETYYKGNSGLKLNFLDKLILGIKEKNINLAFSNSITENSKLLINRNIIKRAKIALPDVIYDENPYTVINNEGEIFWIIDAYTLSSSYPYSNYTEIIYNNQKRNINYIRNSIKVIINAYSGEIKYYITDRTDPIAMAYRKVYPEIFEKLDSPISEDIQSQFIYPQFLYNVQATMLEEYHNTKADVLYRSDDTWSKATYSNSNTSSKKTNNLDAYYTMVSIGEKEKIGLVQIYTQKEKQNIKSYLIGYIENGENKLALKTMQSDNNILGPMQLDKQIMQDEKIQKEIEALTVTGAKVSKNRIIVPIENTLLYIEPIYQTLVNESDLPALKKVIVASGNKLAIGNNLTEALGNLISQYATKIEIETTDDINGLIDTIIKANDNLTDSINTNNWELMGTDIQRLQQFINLLKKHVEEEKVKNTINSNNTSEEDTLNVTNIQSQIKE